MSSTSHLDTSTSPLEHQRHRMISNIDNEVTIGGGAINEKPRIFSATPAANSPTAKYQPNTTSDGKNEEQYSKSYSKTNYDPENCLSHLLHSIVGLDRYPNYLSRWNYNHHQDIHRLEEALLSTLQRVQTQKETIQDNRYLMSKLIEEFLHHQEEDEVESNDDGWSLLLHGPRTWSDLKHILHPHAYKTLVQAKNFHIKAPNKHKQTRIISELSEQLLQDVIHGRVDVQLNAAILEDWIEEEMYDVYSFPLLSKMFCKKIVQFVKQLVVFSQEREEYSSLNLGRRVMDMDTMFASLGLAQQASSVSSASCSNTISAPPFETFWLNDFIFNVIIKPMSKHLFADRECNGETLDWRQGYIVGYTPEEQDVNMGIATQRSHLVAHTDDSEVTMNIGMGEKDVDEVIKVHEPSKCKDSPSGDYCGGELNFWNLRGTKEEGDFVGQYEPKIGYAILHAGRHLHEVTKVTYPATAHTINACEAVKRKNRYNYIIWARSWNGIRKEVCPCCWLNRRNSDSPGDKKDCICGKRWN